MTMIASNFDRESGVPFRSTLHTTRSDIGDIQKVTLALTESNVFAITCGRTRVRFPGMQ